jgi:hypothetical protein
MALAMVVPDSVEVGETIKVTVSGATIDSTLSIEVTTEEIDGGVAAKYTGPTSHTGTFDSTGLFDFQPLTEGHVEVKVTDITATTSVTDEVGVFRSA